MRISLGLSLLFISFVSLAQNTVKYRVTFSGTWVSADSSVYPLSAHFTELIGATHSPGNAFWKRGELASKGVEDVAELGAMFNLRSELATAVQAGTTGSPIIFSSLFGLPNSVSKIISVDLNQSNITLISMLAPSSDWFVGVSDLPLRTDGSWNNSLGVDLHPYDAGTENGETFMLSNPATSPPQTISLIGNSPFLLAKPVVGQLSFELLTPIDPIDPAMPVVPSTPDQSAPAVVIAPIVELIISDN